ncbi:MAG: VOC family protein [Pseudomonadales bacterium]|jgi:catechol 2,3-dioxygenase|nr:VOC family protein [Pseudomonadales bacterium]MDP6473054.1 VOC family protein [Pseudomonadales bacterium]MDP6826189.1 VOC family protein [Pseudomonadales bacterium]MDP6973434.1 VOC family protein [Pseudomonadales bacterium]|tara:strand:+ start:633 stop:1181 length:549 start_codon:yes stop_codon:yes gene_type:complete
MQLRWSHTAILVRDMNEMVDFYTKVLGFDVTDRGQFPAPGAEDSEIVFLSQVDTDHHQIAFVDGLRDENPPNSVHHMAFRVNSLDDVKRMDARLEEDGRVPDRLPITHGNAWSIYFDDPEGNTIEVFSDSPWHVQQPQALSWDRDKSNDKILDETKRTFQSDPKFAAIEGYYGKRTEELKDR